MGGANEDEITAGIKTAVDAGVNHLDDADVRVEVLPHRFLVSAQLCKRYAQAVTVLRIIRIEAQGCLIFHDPFLKAPLFRVDKGEVMMSLQEVGFSRSASRYSGMLASRSPAR